jgi:phage recombination protein Bet
MTGAVTLFDRETGEVVAGDALGAHVSRLSRDQIDLIKRTIADGASDDELALFIGQCNRTGLDPFSRQIYLIERWDAKRGNTRQVQISIDGQRLVAQRSGVYRGQVGPLWCGEDGVWKDVWLAKEPPAAARVGVLREGFAEPTWGVSLYRSSVQKKKDGSPNAFWARDPAGMLAKCAESQALRKAFPQELSGLYTTEEMGQARNEVAPAAGSGAPGLATAAQKAAIRELLRAPGISESEREKIVAKLDQLTAKRASQAIDYLKGLVLEQQGRVMAEDGEPKRRTTTTPLASDRGYGMPPGYEKVAQEADASLGGMSEVEIEAALSKMPTADVMGDPLLNY